MREFKIKVPFIGYSEVIVTLTNDHEFDSEKEILDAVWEDAENAVYAESNALRSCERFETFKYVEAFNGGRYRTVDHKFAFEIEDVTEEYDEEGEEDDSESIHN